MPLQLQPVTLSDMPDVATIQRAAFSTGMISLLMPRPITTEAIAKSIEAHAKSMTTEPDVFYVKVVDTDLDNKIIAVGKWRINKAHRGQEDVERMLPKPGKAEEGNQAVLDMMRYLRWGRSTFMGGKPFCFLHMLVCDPNHGRRGAGAMLVKWGTSQADVLNLPCFLEASEMGRPLYARLGFVPVHEEIFHGAKYGLDTGDEVNTCMIRQPVS
ncbi:hypothetical protein K504DRAFT_476343 [Pleomassaria siparia CBS 279.74]|uniref:N-acetyltransferase domain-containing protein n=1 Tax=Pleomassaria siparia CBS 279.74 TaxID=1314801 RepID=A0A6G1KD02_9PLEO|nr:hypothetical protein K504DRAFT_476343 [Pleomassaria siparia CBS 279.74]